MNMQVGDSTTVKTNIDNALSIGVPVVIGEFGAQHTNGDVDEQTILNYCAQKGVGYLGWSWKGNGSGLEYLDISNTWDGSSLTDWGNTLFLWYKWNKEHRFCLFRIWYFIWQFFRKCLYRFKRSCDRS